MKICESLSSRWYIDPLILELERKRIFLPAWWLLGPVHAVQNIGDYFSDTVCGWPVFVVRSDDGELRGFRNVCRHRGSILLENGVGNVKSIRCPYHGWQYSCSGALMNAPKFGADLKEYADDLNLYPIDVHVWNSLVFVRLDTQCEETFDEWIGEVANYCAEFPPPSELDYFGEFTVQAQTNWKTYCDNTVEGYHLNLVHRRLAIAIAGADVELRSLNNGRSVAFVIDHKEGSDGAKQRGQKGLWIYHFPGLQIVLGDRVFKAERVEAEATSGVRSRNWAWYGTDMSESEKEDAFQWAESIVNEDFDICSKVFQNMLSGNYHAGPLSPVMECHVARFQEIVRELVGDVSD